MGAKLNLIGLKFGRLNVISENGRDRYGLVLWRCKCDCGRESIVRGAALKSGKTKSCGCGIGIAAIKSQTRHGLRHSKLYECWKSMKARCQNPNHISYLNYGGRGITVCERWMKFENFYSDMARGYMRGLQIDRRDNNGNYEPSNCRWVNSVQQQRNKRDSCFIEISGITKTLAEWCQLSGLAHGTIRKRIMLGWTNQKLLKGSKNAIHLSSLR